MARIYLESVLTKVQSKAAGETEEDIKNALAAMADLRSEMSRFSEILKELRIQTKPGGGHSELPSSNAVFKEGNVRTHLEALRDAIRWIAENLKWLKDDDTCRLLKMQERTRERMKRILADLLEQDMSLKITAEAHGTPNRIAMYDLFVRHWVLVSQSVDVASLIRENFYRDTKGLAYTSATICMDGSYETFKKIVGMDRPFFLNKEATTSREFRYASLESPFSAARMEMIVPPEAVRGDYANKSTWINSVVKILPELIKKNRGRTLVLFSSYQDLETVAKRIGDEITEAGFPLLIQRSGHSTGDLCDEFRAVKESVLFGVDTFWYGVDFKGDTLTQVIITRIPYPSPQDPINTARKKTLRLAEYWERYLYDTHIKIKQGIGRLIRCETDHGKVIVLDARYLLQKEKMFSPWENREDSLHESADSKDSIPEALTGLESDSQQELFSYHCGRCGREIDADAVVCSACGQQLREGSKPAFRSSVSEELELLRSAETQRGVDHASQDMIPATYRQFIEGMCVIEPGATAYGRPLHQAYRKWCSEKCGDERPLSRRNFWELLVDQDKVKKTSGNPRIFSGIRLKSEASYRQSALDDLKTGQETDISQVRELVLSIGNTGVQKERLVKFFEYPDYEVRRRACSAANKLRDKEIIKRIGPCLHAPEPQVRYYALKAVLSSRCHYVIDHVEKLSKTEDKEYNIVLCRRILNEVVNWQLIGYGELKKMVCLAASRKLGGYCVAGREWSAGRIGPWIRPVSAKENGELTLEDITLQNGMLPGMLDILRIPVKGPALHPYQGENVFISEKKGWQREGRILFKEIGSFCDGLGMLWLNGYHSMNGLNDRIPEEVVRQERWPSLCLIKPDAFSLIISNEYGGKKKVRANIDYNSIQYRLGVTDPEIERRYLQEDDGEYLFPKSDVYLTISLGEPFQGFVYKLVAGVITVSDER